MQEQHRATGDRVALHRGEHRQRVVADQLAEAHERALLRPAVLDPLREVDAGAENLALAADDRRALLPAGPDSNASISASNIAGDSALRLSGRLRMIVRTAPPRSALAPGLDPPICPPR